MPAPPASAVTPPAAPWLSSAERFALAGIALMTLLQAFDAAGAALEYRRDALLAQPWRVLGAHLVHVNGRHLLLNAVVWFVFARLFAPELGAMRQAAVLAAGAAAISLGMAALYPQIGWYRGASGALYALYFAGATRWLAHAVARREAGRPRRSLLPAALTFGGWAKIIGEMPATVALPFNPWLDAPVVPQAHLLGAAAGTACSLAFALLDRPRADAQPGPSGSGP